LKAGGAYVPMDPEYPGERLRYMVDDSEMRLVLTQERLLDVVPDGAVEKICLDGSWQWGEGEGEEVGVKVEAENLAYVIYTSGSTGKPKGVMIRHGGLSNYVQWAMKYYRVGEGGGAPVQSSVTFDLTVTSLWIPLAAGRRVVLVRAAPGVDGLAKVLEANRDFSLVKITPIHLMLLENRLVKEEVEKRIRVLVIGGEALLGESLEFWQKYAPKTRLINEYGPTETVVGCCVYEVRGESGGNVPIGKPIANTELYVLDGEGEPVAVGVVGELYIGGMGLARGYVKRPDLTGERFVPNPFSEGGGERLYRTGDLVKYREDGVLEYVGRMDHQVKIRGYRIELGEIEAVLGSHAGVREAVVVVKAGEGGEKRLVGYWVGSGEGGVSAGELRGYLKEKLPEYMVPGVLMELQALPLTPNGKVDRKALPDVEVQARDSAAEYVLPRNDLEKAIAAIWREVLHVDTVSIHDNFFDLGGHSLHTIQVHGALKQLTGGEILLTDLFRYSTVALLAEHMTKTDQEGQQEEKSSRDGEQLEKLKQGRTRLAERFRTSLATR
jgi:amino acid adenylation domain-containing protein